MYVRRLCSHGHGWVYQAWNETDLEGCSYLCAPCMGHVMPSWDREIEAIHWVGFCFPAAEYVDGINPEFSSSLDASCLYLRLSAVSQLALGIWTTGRQKRENAKPCVTICFLMSFLCGQGDEGPCTPPWMACILHLCVYVCVHNFSAVGTMANGFI